MIIETLIASLLPVGVEGLKQAAVKFFGGVKPTTIEEQIKMDESEIAKIQAIAALDQPVGNPSQWVVDLRASSRYVGSLALIGAGLVAMFYPGIDMPIRELSIEAANIAFGFLFGSRLVASYSALKRR